ncbi:cation transporter [Bifidobacterium oedipodis]|uniref:Cobalt transporter n=1 Tax=Bifidobacterium oedipodis TaxID=2675322 RepID=A0A7Y0ERP7_9BIFI|nr:cation transporter [Bifidobacterium sp. DSM 109957]NMM95185.1 cobalt transporter [Bifidobacterium sp. DSM 109957]
MQHKQIERRALTVGIIVNIVMVVSGFIVFFMTGLKALFLDASFTVISVISGLVATILSRQSVRTTERYPNGMFALEPMYALAKAIFTLALLTFAVVDAAQAAWDYVMFGIGERMTLGPVVIYEIAMVAISFGLVAYYRRSNHTMHNASTMLTAEANGTLVDGMISAGIGAVAVALMFLPADTPLDFLNYTGDFFITTAIALIALKEPLGVLRDAFIELVGGVHEDDDTNQFVESAAQRHLPDGTEYDHVLVFKTGMNFTVDVYLTGVAETINVDNLIACKRALENELKRTLHIVDVDFVFD